MQLDSAVPETRVRTCNDAPVRGSREFVLYWMNAARRLESNFGLQRAVEWARCLNKPLVIFEPLRLGYEWASDRHHAFILEGMADHSRRLRNSRTTYFPYVEREPGEGRGLLRALAKKSCVVVTDDFPCFFLPRMVASAAEQVTVRLESVDSNGILPLRATERVFGRAVDFRRHLHASLPSHLTDWPSPRPLRGAPLPRLGELPSSIRRRWKPATPDELRRARALANQLPLDHRVAPIDHSGGSKEANATLDRFLERLTSYDNRAEDGTSALSFHLHFGHISSHQIFDAVAEAEGWDRSRIDMSSRAKRAGYWQMSPGAEAFVDELVTWRELGFNCCALTDDFDQYESLPEWARKTLEKHEPDERPWIYDDSQLEAAETHDEIWNSAQRQLVGEGRIQSYLRMLWGKKILEWSRSPREALSTLIHLNNKYAVDGRDPNSYSGIFWCLGRYDRPWGPERPIFGTVRYMSSDSTRRKLALEPYLARWAE